MMSRQPPDDMYLNYENWHYVMKGLSKEEILAGWMAAGGQEYFMTAKTAVDIFGLDALLKGIERNDFKVRWTLGDGYFGPWVPFTGFVFYRATHDNHVIVGTR
jgi:hypothetical protein